MSVSFAVPSQSLQQTVQSPTLQKGTRSECFNVLTGLSSTIGIALFIIGCLAVAGHMQGTAVGWSMIGLSVPMLLISIVGVCIGKNIQHQGQASIAIALEILFLVIGACAVAGAVSPVVAGWCVIGPTLGALALACVLCYCCCCVGGAMLGAGVAASSYDSPY